MKGKFIGDTKGNRDINHNLSQMNYGGGGESHNGRPSSKFIGDTKGNRDLPINRTDGVSMGHGGKHKAGG
jgi:hypothetical protein